MLSRDPYIIVIVFVFFFFVWFAHFCSRGRAKNCLASSRCRYLSDRQRAVVRPRASGERVRLGGH